MDYRLPNRSALTSLMGLAVLLPSAAAQAQVATEGPETSAARLDTITVTANRREESILDVALSVTAVDNAAIERAGVDSLDDLQTLTPGLNLGGRSSVRPQISLRGIGTPQFTNAIDSPIGVFVDDVPIPRFSSFFAPFTDVERIEVLRGPQGTLYGRNTIAGALSIVTKKPTNELQAGLELGLGSYSQRSFKGSVSGPIIEDQLFFRLAGYSNEQDGYIENLATGGTANGDDTTALYAKLRYVPSHNWTIDLSADYGSTDAPGEASEPSDRSQLLLFPAPGVSYDIGPTQDPFTYASDIDPNVFREQFGLSLRNEINTDDFDVVSITAWRDSLTKTVQDNDGTELRILNQSEKESSLSYSQEFRILSSPGGALTFDDRFEWLVGAFYFKEDSTRASDFEWGSDSLFVFLAQTLGVPPLTATSADGVLVDRVRNRIETESVALFGRGTWQFNDQWSATLGLRYSKDDKVADYTGLTETPGLPPSLAPFTAEGFGDSWDSVDYDATLEYRLFEDTLIYARYATGYKSGGFQPVPTTEAAARTVVEPESLGAFEIGAKGDLFDGRARYSAALFDYQYKDLQLTQIVSLPQGGAAALISNAEGVESRGFEFEAEALLTPGWSARLGYTYLDTTFVDFDAVIPGSGNVNIGGERLPRAPEHQITLASSYSFDLTDRLEMTASGDLMWQDETNLLIGGRFVLPAVASMPNQEAAYSLGNFALRVDDEQSGAYATIFVRNAFDETYRTGINVIGETPSVDYWGAPRTFGIKLGWTLK